MEWNDISNGPLYGNQPWGYRREWVSRRLEIGNVRWSNLIATLRQAYLWISLAITDNDSSYTGTYKLCYVCLKLGISLTDILLAE